MSTTPLFHPLRVRGIEPDTAEAVIVTFEVPPELRDVFGFTQGQYLTLRREVDGQDLRRSYSICAGIDEGQLRVGVRQVAGGKLDGFVAFYRAKALEGAMKLKPGTGNFEGEAIKSSRGQLAPAEISGSAQIENGQLKGTFKGDFEGTFEAKLDHPKSPTLGAMPPKNGKVLFDGKPGDAWKDFRWKIGYLLELQQPSMILVLQDSIMQMNPLELNWLNNT